MTSITTTRTYPANTFAGVCRRCGTEVAAGEGQRRHGKTGWIVAHLDDACPAPLAPIEPSAAFMRLVDALELLPPVSDQLTDQECTDIVTHLFAIHQILAPPM